MHSFKALLFPLYTLVQAVPSAPHVHLGRATGTSPGLHQTTLIVEAANKLLSLLTAEQKASIQFPYEAVGHAYATYFNNRTGDPIFLAAEVFGQAVWTNYPNLGPANTQRVVPRPGVLRSNFTAAQDEAAMNLLKVMLSEAGYTRIQEILDAGQYYTDTVSPLDYYTDPGTYTFGFFGQPSVSDLWMIQFGGHHIGVNLAMYKDQAVLAPLHTGNIPTLYVKDNVTKRSFVKENELAFDLMSSLDASLREQAVIPGDLTNMTLGPGLDGVPFPTAGVSVALFNSTQQEMVYDLASLWVGMLNDVHSASRLAEVRAGLNDTYWAWIGNQTRPLPNHNGKAYFRIKASNLWIEYVPQVNQGDPTLHCHTIYRDELRGYGRTLKE